MMRIKYTLIISFIFFLFTCQKVNSCSLVYGLNGDTILIGFNEDNIYGNPYIWFTEKAKNKYACAFITYNYDVSIGITNLRFSGKLNPQQGYNSKGLFFDFFATPYNNKNSEFTERDTASFNTMREILERCATVEEAITYLNKSYFPGFSGAKIFLADTTGDYVIYNGEIISRRKDEVFCVVTNFLENNKGAGEYPCERHKKGTTLFANKPEVTSNNFKNILKNINQNWDNLKGGTVYSAVLNLKSGDFKFFYYQDFENPYSLNILDELNNDTKEIKLKEKFSKRTFPLLYETLLAEGVDSAVLKFYDLQKDDTYNSSESELLFFIKFLLQTNNLVQAEEVFEFCMEKYPDSQLIKESWSRLRKENESNYSIPENEFSGILALKEESGMDMQYRLLKNLTISELYVYSALFLIIIGVSTFFLVRFAFRRIKKLGTTSISIMTS